MEEGEIFEGVVYRYINMADNGKSYVGCTLDEEARRAQWDNPNQGYGGRKINDARKKYGLDSFAYQRLYSMTGNQKKNLQTHLEELESKNIAYYDSFANGYNSNTGGRGLKKCSVRLTPENGGESFTLESIIDSPLSHE
jgi:hypothetical protein